ncbi:diguanylate phosphodiesterase / Rtn protein [Pseudomonas sp. M47T1]|uniref:CSS-motif domain-containing protein n=1 Tax=Pseudomonas sp. M47T1 TaxID=1179778 RepID=UPI000260806A|nr:CSS-motif domain-containing protein [Pseudomonas sp. M47T1]EIK93942.1 diguanylate phosphodiesterase / Rtn protein [Pseudomonas sp. M47T1]
MKYFLPFPPALRGVVAAVLIGLLPVASGLLVMRWHVERSLAVEAGHIAGEAVRQVDNIIDQAAQSAKRLMPLAGQPCAAVLQRIRDEVTLEPLVRSANLLRNQQAYCSSFYGAYQRTVDATEYSDHNLLLRASNSVTPDEASLVYRHYEQPLGVRAVIDGRTLARVLRQIEGNATLVLQVGDALLWSNGSISDGDGPDHAEHHTLLASERYGYQMHSGFAPGSTRAHLKTQALSTVGGLLLLGVLTGGVCHWLYRRPRR